MTLDQLISHHEDKALPRPAFATLCALQRYAKIERCRYAVQCRGITVAAFHGRAHADKFADVGRAETPEDAPITVIDLDE